MVAVQSGDVVTIRINTAGDTTPEGEIRLLNTQTPVAPSAIGQVRLKEKKVRTPSQVAALSR